MGLSNENQLMTQVIDLASITADADVYGAYFPKKSRIVSAYLVNGAGITADDTNKAVIQLKNGSTVVASHSTAATAGNGSLVANTPAAMVLSATDADSLIAAGSWLKVNYDESGTYAMTTAKVIINYYPL